MFPEENRIVCHSAPRPPGLLCPESHSATHYRRGWLLQWGFLSLGLKELKRHLPTSPCTSVKSFRCFYFASINSAQSWAAGLEGKVMGREELEKGEEEVSGLIHPALSPCLSVYLPTPNSESQHRISLPAGLGLSSSAICFPQKKGSK